MAGFDEPTKIVSGLQLLQAGIIDRETLQENMDGLDNLQKINNRITKDEAENVLFETLKVQATQGDPNDGLNMAKLFFKQIRVQGSTMGRESEFSDMLQFVEKNSITPIIDKVFSMEQAIEAHRRMLNSEQLGKIILKI